MHVLGAVLFCYNAGVLKFKDIVVERTFFSVKTNRLHTI